MWIAFVIIGVIALVVAIFFIATTVRKKKPTPDKDLLAELDSLKEKGLITEQEYNDKRAEIISRKGGKK